VGRKSRETIMKRVRENKRREKAALKRERRLARKQGRDPDTPMEPEEPTGDAAFAPDMSSLPVSEG
jgi:hypothetical protein